MWQKKGPFCSTQTKIYTADNVISFEYPKNERIAISVCAEMTDKQAKNVAISCEKFPQ